MKTDFISIADHSTEWLDHIFHLTSEIKSRLKNNVRYTPLEGKTVAMIFQKPSARTRISFEVGTFQLGGHALYLAPTDIQMGKRESTADIARVLSRYNDCIMARLFGHEDMIKLGKYASVPVINGLTDYNHPCQIMADIYTIFEHLGRKQDYKLVYVGDGNNIVNSFLNISAKFPFHLVIACPEGYEPDNETLVYAESAGLSKIEISHDPIAAVTDADVIYTDVWASMGQEEEKEKRARAFAEFQVNSKLVAHAKPDYKFMHCLPAHRGEEVTDEVVDSPNSIVFDEAENRMHVQKAIMVNLVTGK
ncbi:MAG: ornithine carbamoyltransferase [bacterium]|nr:ornithine carbamoyltransferase [bacterium]